MKDNTREEINRVAESAQRCRQCSGTGKISDTLGFSMPCPYCASCPVCAGLKIVYDRLSKKYVECPECCGKRRDRQFVHDLQRLTDLADDLSSRAEGTGTLACLCRLLAKVADEIRQSYLRNLEERS